MRLNNLSIPVLLIAGLGLLIWGKSEKKEQEINTLPSRVDRIALSAVNITEEERSVFRGKSIYLHFCAICHGEEGDGNGFNAYTLDPKPQDFRSLEFWKRLTPEGVKQSIRYGGAGVKKSNLMPPWGNTLSEQELEDVEAYIRNFPAKRHRNQ